MSLVRGVLLAGKFKTQHELNTMSADSQRNTLIFELSLHSKQPNLQSFSDDDLAGMGAVMVFLREAKLRDDAALKAMTADDQRNVLIVEIGSQTGLGSELQGLSNIELVLMGLGKPKAGGLAAPSYIRGVMLAGKFRSQHELNRMSTEDQRNTLIVELAGRTKQNNFQSFNDFQLADAGAALVFLREAKIRDDVALKAMTADDQRNVLIVEIGGQTGLGSKLQGLKNMDLVRAALGVDPVFTVIKPGLQAPPPLPYFFRVDSLEVRTQKADSDHSDSDWLSFTVSVANPITKDVRTLPGKTIHLEGSIKTGDVIAGAFATDQFEAADTEIVVINYLITNLGSTDAEEQFAQAVKVTNKVVDIAGPIVGAAIGLFFGDPGEGFKVGQQVAKGFDTAISTLGDVFDFLGIHAGPPNCNGEVLHDTLTFTGLELAQSEFHPASREYTGPQKEGRCGGAPVSKLNFSVHRVRP